MQRKKVRSGYHKEDGVVRCSKRNVGSGDSYRKWDDVCYCVKKKMVYAVDFVCDQGHLVKVVRKKWRMEKEGMVVSDADKWFKVAVFIGA